MGGIAHANRHGHQPGCDMCNHRVHDFPTGHHSPKHAKNKGKQMKLNIASRDQKAPAPVSKVGGKK